jgi:hypothetical protein
VVAAAGLFSGEHSGTPYNWESSHACRTDFGGVRFLRIPVRPVAGATVWAIERDESFESMDSTYMTLSWSSWNEQDGVDGITIINSITESPTRFAQ